jgi:hypothetical protein
MLTLETYLQSEEEEEEETTDLAALVRCLVSEQRQNLAAQKELLRHLSMNKVIYNTQSISIKLHIFNMKTISSLSHTYTQQCITPLSSRSISVCCM